jgi:hypothetical protein
MADAYKSAGPAAGAYDDDYSEQGPPSEAEQDDFYAGQDDFYAGQDDFGQAQYRREEDAASLAPTTLTGPVLDQSHLRPGKQAALLSHERTLELYRANAKKVCFTSALPVPGRHLRTDPRPRPPVRVCRVHDRRLQDPAHPCPDERERDGG